jgi:hypothetical protein
VLVPKEKKTYEKEFKNFVDIARYKDLGDKGEFNSWQCP